MIRVVAQVEMGLDKISLLNKVRGDIAKTQSAMISKILVLVCLI